MINWGKDQSKTLNGPMEKSSQNFSTKKNISSQVDELLKRKDDMFNFDSETEDLEDLADEIFEALYQHTKNQTEETE
jgi:hypothetical protein|tara:strand:+ start:2274 stop:2504 length:231 start_codon:yes stop_codon:yes gene_type:complete